MGVSTKRRGQRHPRLVLAGELDARLGRELAHQAERGPVVGEDACDECVECAVSGDDCESAQQRRADSPALPGVLDGDRDLGITRRGAVGFAQTVVARHADDLVAVERDERFATAMIDIGQPQQRPRREPPDRREEPDLLQGARHLGPQVGRAVGVPALTERERQTAQHPLTKIERGVPQVDIADPAQPDTVEARERLDSHEHRRLDVGVVGRTQELGDDELEGPHVVRVEPAIVELSTKSVTGRRQLAKRSDLKLQLRHSRPPVPHPSSSPTLVRQPIRRSTFARLRRDPARRLYAAATRVKLRLPVSTAADPG
ncbi:MAG: hypothetical protein QOG65_3720, partial [Actinomycetota bacterium]|nr:hypothetical protein [Actinomycetota bacterium]